MVSSTKDILFSLGRPISPLYSLLMRARARAYASGMFSSFRVPGPVISIGNLSMGGTGKTPHVIHLSEMLLHHGLRPAIVSRGYGGKAGKGPLVVSKGSGPLVDPGLGGDEPVMMAQRLEGVMVVVGSDRVAGAEYALSHLGADVIVLDDGFQHLRLQRDLDIVLLPATNPFGNRRIFPGGDLREPISALGRASCILITRADTLTAKDHQALLGELREHVHGKPIFFSKNKVTRVWSLREGPEAGSARTKIQDKPLFAFCGLGTPESFLATLKSTGAEVTGYMWFQDHHIYNEKDLQKLTRDAERTGAKILVTTTKDAVKLERGLLDNCFMDILVVDISPEVDKGLWDLVLKTVEEFKRKDGRGGGI